MSRRFLALPIAIGLIYSTASAQYIGIFSAPEAATCAVEAGPTPWIDLHVVAVECQAALDFGGIDVLQRDGQVQDESGKPMAGRALADCPEIVGDEVERVVTWGAGADVGVPAGKWVFTSSGSAARLAMKDPKVMTDLTICGIIDNWDG